VDAPLLARASAPVTVVVTPGTRVVEGVPAVAPAVYVNRTWDERRLAVSGRIQAIFGFIFSLVAILIMVRFVLYGAGASMAGQFATWISTWSEPLVHPFLTLFANPTVPYFHTFEVGDIIALVVYAIATSLICYVVVLLVNPSERRGRDIVQ